MVIHCITMTETPTMKKYFSAGEIESVAKKMKELVSRNGDAPFYADYIFREKFTRQMDAIYSQKMKETATIADFQQRVVAQKAVSQSRKDETQAIIAELVRLA